MKSRIALTEFSILKHHPVEELSPAEVAEFSARAGGDPQKIEGQWIPASGTREVHEILVDAGIIGDPALRGNAAKCLWVAESDWLYRTTFEATPSTQARYLYFGGLDTIAHIYLNGRHLAFHNDMYLPLRVEVTEALEPGANTLLLHFRSPYDYMKRHPLPARLTGRVPERRSIRKNDTDFTDYMGAKPYLTPIGIYDEVQLETVDGVEILEADVAASLDADYAAGALTVAVRASGDNAEAEVVVELRDPHGAAGAIATLRAPLSVAGTAGASEGRRATLSTRVAKPELWWPRGYGKQPLYPVVVTIERGGRVLDRVEKRIGFRRLTIDGSFDCRVNGRPITLWGAMTSQLWGITHRWDASRSDAILDLAENAHMNSIRVWGACDRYADQFYDEADRRGILLWQEFFHDYGAYPDMPEFRQLCRHEAEYQVTRLKHHPSILMWCGGNECLMGQEFDHIVAQAPLGEYIGEAIFTEEYRSVCNRLDPGRYYHVNSPVGGAFANDPREGDTHGYTSTWYVPGGAHPVMIAEQVRTGPYSARSMKRYLGDAAWPAAYRGKQTESDPYPWPDSWNAITSAEGWRKIPPVELFYDPDSLESAVYRFGAAHSRYLRDLVERSRRGKPSEEPGGERISRGHHVWRFVDPWPMIYGSMVDYYLEPTMAYYELRRTYEPVLISFDVQNLIYVWVVNDSGAKAAGTLTVRLFDPNGNRTVAEIARQVTVESGESKMVTNLNELGQFPRTWILFAQLSDRAGTGPGGRGGAQIARANELFDIERHLHFPDATLTLKAEGEAIVVSTDRFARSIELSGDERGDEFGWFFDDNYFDLLPGETKRVRVAGRHRQGTIRARAHYASRAAELAWRQG